MQFQMKVLVLLIILFRASELWSQNRTDTVYYESGEVKMLLLDLKKPDSPLGPGQKILVYKALQYDKCGNLRNITNFYEAYVDPNMQGIQRFSPFSSEDSYMEGESCETPWRKPYINYPPAVRSNH